MLDPIIIRKDFPIFTTQPDGKPLIYLDSSATTQKPSSVIDAISDYYRTSNANIHRGLYSLSEKSTRLFEESRETVRRFINATNSSEIIFTKNATESINLIAGTWGETNIRSGDEIVTTIYEHHSNFVPWQQLAGRVGAKLQVAAIKPDFTLDESQLLSLIGANTKLLAVTGMSNVTGFMPNLKKIIFEARNLNPDIKILVDGTQLAAHSPVDVQDMDCDFFVMSAHKMLGPTGVGMLFARQNILESMPPYMFGGDMIKSVSLTETTWNDIPHKFEAGTPNIADVIALTRALNYLESTGPDNIRAHEKALLEYAVSRLSALDFINIYNPGTADNFGGILSFNIKGVHPHDVGTILDNFGICIRAGHHCAQPFMTSLGINATCRISFYLYNEMSEIDTLVEALNFCHSKFK